MSPDDEMIRALYRCHANATDAELADDHQVSREQLMGLIRELEFREDHQRLSDIARQALRLFRAGRDLK